MSKAIIQELSIKKGKRVIAISDIHGHLALLKQLLEKLRFGPSDTLIIVGDMVEKGPEHLATLRFIMELYKKGNVHIAMGNVDHWSLDKFFTSRPDFLELFARYEEHWGNSLFSEMREALSLPLNSIEDLPRVQAAIQSHYNEEIAFLQGLPTILAAGNFLFVHGGVPTDDLNALSKMDAYGFMKNDDFLSQGHSFSRYVVVGHFPVTLYGNRFMQHNPIIDEQRKIICIDGGIGLKKCGQLNALVIDDMEEGGFSFESVDALKTITALEDQAESKESFYIRWTDNRVQLLTDEGEFVRVRHKSTGHEMLVPKKDMLSLGEDARCNDASDYRLPVQKGDTLGLVFETPRGAYCKKNGRSGWYMGGFTYEE